MKYVFNEKNVLSKIENQGVLFDTDNDELYYLNETSLDIIEYIQEQPRTFDEICDYVSELYEIENSDYKDDINELLTILYENKFINKL
ncbi:MAG: PqqD family protein [Bacilli bacterium]|nr:PqqD family protein [Bacilli bacterium]